MQSKAHERCKRLLMKNNVLGKRYSYKYTKQVPVPIILPIEKGENRYNSAGILA